MPIEYILLGVGIVLLGIEAVVPGFGFFGVTGLISLLAVSYYLLGGGAGTGRSSCPAVCLSARRKQVESLCFMGETREPPRLYRCRGSLAVSW